MFFHEIFFTTAEDLFALSCAVVLNWHLALGPADGSVCASCVLAAFRASPPTCVAGKIFPGANSNIGDSNLQESFMAEEPQIPQAPVGPQSPPPQPPAPHRGGVILALGILGLVCCFICGIIAWVMGNNDLREMAAGRMDRSGQGMTQAGKICGMISVILQVVGFVIWFLMMAIGVGSGRFRV